MTQDRPKMTPRWSICTRKPRDGRRWPQKWSQDGLKTTPKWCSRVSEVQLLQNWLCRCRSSPREGPRRPKVALRGPKMSKNGPKTAQDGQKMAPRRFQDDAKMEKMALSCRRSANFAKSSMPSSVLSPRRPKTAQSGPKRAQDEPRWPQDGPKTARGWPQDGQKTTPRRTREAASRDHKYQNWRLV